MTFSAYLQQILNPTEILPRGNLAFEEEAKPTRSKAHIENSHSHYLAHFRDGMTGHELAKSADRHYSSAMSWLKRNAVQMKKSAEEDGVRWLKKG